LGASENLQFHPRSFFAAKTWSIFHKKGFVFRKITGIVMGFLKRFLLMFTLPSYDFVYIHREAAPVGPPVFEWIIKKIFRKKIIYDFDDNIWTPLSSEANPRAALVKCNWKVGYICKYSHIVSVGNEFLAKYAQQFNKDVRVIPTVVNTDNYHNRIKNHADRPITIGWTGTYTNLHNLNKVTAVISRLQQKYLVEFLIIANKNPELTDVKYTYKKWELSTEIEDLLQMHIGIMPLESSDIELGKCGFKAIQYMSLGIPAVVSPVGANKNVVEDGVTGYWAETENEWEEYLERLILDDELRERLGAAGRKKMIDEYAVSMMKEKFFALFR
jgi:glycosyltransferase involved in cell wall biosynthesis